MEIVRCNIIDLPYSLHDARVNKIEVVADKAVLNFSIGYFKPTDDDCLPVKREAIISIYGLDLDFCNVYLIAIKNNYGKFTGEKLGLEMFIKQYREIDFEIVNETYGYNTTKFSGYLYEGKSEITKECIFEFYHFGEMKYTNED